MTNVQTSTDEAQNAKATRLACLAVGRLLLGLPFSSADMSQDDLCGVEQHSRQFACFPPSVGYAVNLGAISLINGDFMEEDDRIVFSAECEDEALDICDALSLLPDERLNWGATEEADMWLKIMGTRAGRIALAFESEISELTAALLREGAISHEACAKLVLGE